MQKRAVRFTLLALLLGAGIGTGLIARNVVSQTTALEAGRDDVDGRLDRILTAVNDIGAAQHAYVAPGQSATAAFEQVASLIQRIHADVQAVRPLLQSVEAAELLTVITRATDTLVEADGSARNHYRTGETLWAAEVVFGQARDTLATMTQGVRALQAAESKAHAGLRAQLQQSLWAVLGGGALVWALGLLALTWVPQAAAPAFAVGTDTAWSPADSPADMLGALDVALAAAPLRDAEPQVAIDLAGAASVCAGISKLSSADAFPALLARAAGVIDASGIIIWMGAGDELFAAAAHGYDPRIVARLGSIPRTADNATATAWRTGEGGIVASDMVSTGAIVAPMFGPEGCIGVLAAEVRPGREADPATRAVTAILAAQLSTVVTAWPAASAAPSATPQAEEEEAQPLREASGL